MYKLNFMKGKIFLPEDFDAFYNKEEDDSLFIWDQNGDINDDVKDAIYMKPLYSEVLFEEDFGVVWWNDRLGYWCGFIMYEVKEVETFICETLEELRDDMLAAYMEEEENPE